MRVDVEENKIVAEGSAKENEPAARSAEEEKNASDMITKMELFGADSKGLYMLNSELNARVYSAPSLTL